jgi:hypothetical protein
MYGNILQPTRDGLPFSWRLKMLVLGTKPEEEKMDHTPYVVFRDQGQWKIKSNCVHYGPYATQRDAVRAAVDAAHGACNGQVLLQDQFRIEWTYGKDPYPPNSSDYLH